MRLNPGVSVLRWSSVIVWARVVKRTVVGVHQVKSWHWLVRFTVVFWAVETSPYLWKLWSLNCRLLFVSLGSIGSVSALSKKIGVSVVVVARNVNAFEVSVNSHQISWPACHQSVCLYNYHKIKSRSCSEFLYNNQTFSYLRLPIWRLFVGFVVGSSACLRSVEICFEIIQCKHNNHSENNNHCLQKSSQ